MIALFITGYVVVGAMTISFIFDDPPSWIKKYEWLEIMLQILMVIFWLPYIALNAIVGMFTKVDIWFRRRDD